MKTSTAPLILIIAGLGSLQLVRGQTIGSIQDLPGLARIQAINQAGEIAANQGTGDDVQGVLLDKKLAVEDNISVPGSEQTLIYGMDNSTRIVGAYNLPDHSSGHGFLYFHGTYTTIDVPGGTDTAPRSINASQRIVGDYRDSTGHRHGFFDDKGSFTKIDVPGAVSTYIFGINSSETIVGYYTDTQGHRHGFVSHDRGASTSTVDVPFPGATDTFLYGVSNPGTIVGTYIDSAGTHGFVNFKGVFVSIDAPATPPGIGTFARSVNDNDEILLYGMIAHLTSVF